MIILNYEEIKLFIADFLTNADKSFGFISSPSGTGKTFVLRRYCQENSTAVYLKLPAAKLSTRSLLLEILNSLGVPIVNRYQAYRIPQLIQLLKFVIPNTQISHLVVDDIELVSVNRNRVELFEIIKHLSIELPVKFVLTGTQIPELPVSMKIRSNFYITA
ncbi:ATP-binding protein [Cohnella lupini]|uniref:AAA domain-containing protein n=1 Tax=Cohnella lupini TaxID=1294267 RepID=A0A3D9HNR8_9BACL|nr:ATP-binding protein [Cohnella lupini]RED51118.1 AAA domain-containing protein [Cohnella lupini]